MVCKWLNSLESLKKSIHVAREKLYQLENDRANCRHEIGQQQNLLIKKEISSQEVFLKKIRQLNPDSVSPKDALAILYELKEIFKTIEN